MIEIVQTQSQRIFSIDQAQSLLQLIYRFTEDANKKIKYLTGCYNALPNKSCERALEIQKDMDDLINKWQNKIYRLGAKPKGVWLVDFDNGKGYYCWKFPEVEINHEHGYQDGFTGRKQIKTED